MKKFVKNISIYLVIFALVLAAAFFYKGGGSAEYKQVKFSTLSNYLESGRDHCTDWKRQVCLHLCGKYYGYRLD